MKKNQKSLREKKRNNNVYTTTRQDMLDMFFSFHSCRCHFSYKFFFSVYGILWNFIFLLFFSNSFVIIFVNDDDDDDDDEVDLLRKSLTKKKFCE